MLKFKNATVIVAHWIFARISLVRFFFMIMLFAERSEREDYPPINVFWIYGLMGISLLTSIKGHLPKNLLMFMLFVSGFTNMILASTFIIPPETSNINWKYRSWINLKTSLKLFSVGSIYWRLMSGNAPYLENTWAWLGTSINIITLLIRGLLCIPSEFRVFHEDLQNYDNKASLIQIPVFNLFLGVFMIITAIIQSFPLLMNDTMKKFTDKILYDLQNILNWISVLPIIIRAYTIDMNGGFWKSNGIDQWLQYLWLLDDLTLILGTYVQTTFQELALNEYSKKKAFEKKANMGKKSD